MNSLKERKDLALIQLRKTANPVEPEEKMYFAVLEQAIEDIEDPDPRNNSRKAWNSGHLTPICDTIGLDYEFVLRILGEQNLL